KKFSFHQVRRLLIPYFAWSIILYTFYFLLNNLNIISIPEDISLNPIYLFSDILIYNVRTGNALWFVYILFIIYIVSYLIHSFIDKKATNIFLIIIVLCLGFSANIYLKDEMFVLKRFLVMWIYYEIGTFIGIYIKDISFKANKVLSIILLGLYAFVFILYINSNGIISYSLKIICALLAVFVLYSLSKYNNSWFYRVFNYIGKRTSIIYYIHNPYIVLILITGLTMYTRLNIVISIAITFSVGFIVPLIIGELILTRIKITKLIFLGEKI
ncbi:MAG: acyltransferase, partial [Clostridiaceae bacterium]|nr:acyltransferase [Clostridiaceae bacterium]